MLLLLLLGLAARLLAVAYVPLEPVFDFRRYFEAAALFATEGRLSILGQSYIFQGPAYPVLLGLFFRAFGIGALQGKMFNVLLSSAVMLFMACIGKQLGVSGRGRLLMVGIMALHPGLVLYANVLGTESLSVFLVTASVIFALNRNALSLCFLGAFLAVLSLNRPQYLPVMLLAVLLSGGYKRELVRRAIFGFSVFVLVMAPWAVRNYQLFGAFIPVSANAGYTSMVNNNDNANGHWMPLSEVPISEEDKLRFGYNAAVMLFQPGNEGEKVAHWSPGDDRIALSLAWHWIKTHPRKFAALAVKRLKISFYSASGDMLFWPLHDIGGSSVLFQIVRALDLLLFAAAAAGMWVMVRRRGSYWSVGLIPALIVLGGVGAICIFEGQGRYVLPMIPAALVLASLPLIRDLNGQTPAGSLSTYT